MQGVKVSKILIDYLPRQHNGNRRDIGFSPKWILDSLRLVMRKAIYTIPGMVLCNKYREGILPP